MSIEELLTYCNAAKEVYEYYDGNLAINQDIFDTNEELWNLVKLRNKARDRYNILILKLDEKLNERFDEA